MASADRTEIVELVGRALNSMGATGRVVISGDSIELRSGVPVAISIELVLDQWSVLTAETRQRKAQEIARRLMAARAAVVDPREGAAKEARRKAIIAVSGLFAVLIVAGLARVIVPRLRAEEEPPKVVTPEDPDRAGRLARACDAVRDHIGRGARFGPLALEGFVVELWLASNAGANLRGHPVVVGLVAGDKLAPTADDELAKVIGGTVSIGPGLDAESAARWTGFSAVTVSFADGFGRAFFEEENRPRFIGLADRVARATGATHGALVARCAHQSARAVGAWFRGPDLAGATAVLELEMGLQSDEKVIDSGALATLKGPGGELVNLARAATKVEDLATGVVGTAGGSVTAGPLGNPAGVPQTPPAVTFQFSLAAPARATAAAKDLARAMGIGAR